MAGQGKDGVMSNKKYTPVTLEVDCIKGEYRFLNTGELVLDAPCEIYFGSVRITPPFQGSSLKTNTAQTHDDK